MKAKMHAHINKSWTFHVVYSMPGFRLMATSTSHLGSCIIKSIFFFLLLFMLSVLVLSQDAAIRLSVNR